MACGVVILVFGVAQYLLKPAKWISLILLFAVSVIAAAVAVLVPWYLTRRKFK